MIRKALSALMAASAIVSIPVTQAWGGTPAAGSLRVAIDAAAHNADWSKSAGRQRFVILQEWESARMQALKAADPNVKVLMYKNLAFMQAADGYGNAGAGVTTQQASSDWYLLNTSGQRFTSWSYNYLWAADIGNVGYQSKWADNVLDRLLTQGWDGVFADDTNPTMQYHYTVSAVAKYPSDAAYGAATGAMLKAVGPRIRAANKLIIPNMGAWRVYRPVVSTWLDSVDGGMEEQFTKWGTTPDAGYAPEADWKLMLGAQKDAEAKGKYFLGVAHSANTDQAAARYGWATTLLAADGRSSFALHGDYTNETWFPEYDYDLGAPAGVETAESSGVHRRLYANGLVLVNPTAATQTATLNGTYSGSGLVAATTATMAAHTGLVLTRDGVTTAPTASPAPAPAPITSPSKGKGKVRTATTALAARPAGSTAAAPR